MSIDTLKHYLLEHSGYFSLSQPGEEVYEFRTHIGKLYHFFEDIFEGFINTGLMQTEYTTHTIEEVGMKPYTVSKLQVRLLSDSMLSFTPQGIHFPGSNGIVIIEGGNEAQPDILHLVNDKDACRFLWKIKSNSPNTAYEDITENSLADIILKRIKK